MPLLRGAVRFDPQFERKPQRVLIEWPTGNIFDMGGYRRQSASRNRIKMECVPWDAQVAVRHGSGRVQRDRLSRFLGLETFSASSDVNSWPYGASAAVDGADGRKVWRLTAKAASLNDGHSGHPPFFQTIGDIPKCSELDRLSGGKRETRPAVVVLGMHRSGTSSVAGALVRLGGMAPLHLMPPQLDNERGFWGIDRSRSIERRDSRRRRKPVAGLASVRPRTNRRRGVGQFRGASDNCSGGGIRRRRPSDRQGPADVSAHAVLGSGV